MTNDLLDFKISKKQKKNRINNLHRFKENLNEYDPKLFEKEIEGFKILGKTSVYQQFIAEKDGDLFSINLKKSMGATGNSFNVKKDLSKIKVKTKRLRDVEYDESLFVPIKSNTAIDYCFSTEGGVMPGTNYILIGDPGIGKSSISIEHAARLHVNNPNKKILFICGEMTEIDMIPFTKRFPLWLDIETLFVLDLEDGLYKESIETKLSEGYDFVLGDSFSEISNAVRGDYNNTVKGVNKKSYNEIENWLVDLMITHNLAENECKKHTAFVFIQQMTKGGTFVGSNKLKHNTTGMFEVRYTKSGDRKIVITKNRRGFEYNNLHFSFTKDSNNPIKYDTDRIMRDKKVEEEIRKAAEEQLDQERETNAWFEKLGVDMGDENDEIFDDSL